MILLITTLFGGGKSVACEGDASPIVTPSLVVEWLDEMSPSLAITGPDERNVAVSLDIIAMSGGEIESWSVEDLPVTAAQTAEIEIDGIGGLSVLPWAHWGVQLSVRVRIYDAETGDILDFGSAPERWLWFDEQGFEMLLDEELVERLAPVATEEGEIVVAVLPPVAIFEGVQ